MLLAFAVGVWYTESKVNAPLDFKIGLTIETDAAGQLIQFYCHKHKVYTGKSRVQNKYSPENQSAPNTYNIVNDISCGPESTHLRFDPLPAEGVVAITQMRVHTRYWHQVNLVDAIQHIKPINSIKSVELIDDKIVITSIGNDPYIELSNQLQSYVNTEKKDYIMFLAKYSIMAFLLLKVLAWLLSALLRNGQQIVDISHSAKNHFDSLTARFFNFIHRFFSEPIRLSGLLVFAAFIIYLFSSYVFTGHLIKGDAEGYSFTFVFTTLQFFILLCAYTILLGVISSQAWYRVLVGFCLLLMTILVSVDVSLFSLNGMHISHGLGMLTDGGVSQFFNNLRFTGLSKSELSLYVFAIFAGITLSLALVWFFEYKIKRFQLNLSIYQSVVVVLLSLVLIYASQSLSTSKLNSNQIVTYEEHHPIGLSFFDIKDYLISFETQAKPYLRQDLLPEDTHLAAASAINNIYLFIFESLREDVVNSEITPYLENFRQDSWRFSKSVASGNATHYGWFSIINSKQPFIWERYKRLPDKHGSLPLQVFKEIGYNINIYSAKDLSYLQSDQIMFNQDLSLVDYISPHPDMSPPEHDERITNDLILDIKTKHQTSKNLNIILLDSTHYPYRWKAGEITEITPYQGTPAEGTDLSSAVRMIKKDKHMIFNRYKNAVKYMDYLFGKSLATIKQNNLTENSMIVAVGDHGQQFMEKGYMLHGFTLFNEDIDVPIYFQAPQMAGFQDDKVASHADIMPTILDYLNVDLQNIHGIHGSSLLRDTPHNYKLSSVAGEQNTPSSFVLSSPHWKLFFKTEKNNPADFKKLYVTKITDQNDQPHMPGSGLKADYLAFINQHFPDFLKQTPILQ